MPTGVTYLHIIAFGKDYIKWQLKNLDENYSRDDRSVQLTIQEVINNEENNNNIAYSYSSTNTLKKKIKNSEVFTTHIDELTNKEAKYKITATIYYSYSEMNKPGSDIEAVYNQEGRSFYQKMKILNSNFPNYQIGVEDLSSKSPSETQIKTYKEKIKKLKEKYEIDSDFYALRKELVYLAYFNDKTKHDLYLYYPFISAYDIAIAKVDIEQWNFNCSDKKEEMPLAEKVETTKRYVDISVNSSSVMPTTKYEDDWLLPSNNVMVNASSSTQYKSLFPPILESYQPSFVGKETSEYEIFFRLSEYTNIAEVAHVDFRITLQSNNSSVVNSNLWPDQVIYKIKNKGDIIEHGNGLYSAKIKTNIFKTSGNYDLIADHWEANTYYKVQARLGTSWSGWENAAEYVKWRNEQSSQGRFSEWSTVMILKSINRPSVQILNNQGIRETLNPEDSIIEVSTSPLFYGQYKQSNLNDNELLDTYEFVLYNAENGEKLEESGVLQYNNTEQTNNEVTVSYRFLNNLVENKDNKKAKYKVQFNITTVNGYKASDNYYFETDENVKSEIDPNFTSDNFQLIHQDALLEDEEDGLINLILEPKSNKKLTLSGNFIITRSEDNGIIWEDLKVFKSFNEKEIKYTDYTAESGKIYRYGVQKVNEFNQRTQRIMSEEVSINFEHIFLYAQDKQLKLKYNPNISSFKHTVLASKQDTLGGKYPHISRNGFVYYAEFPFEALISFNSDENGNFMKDLKQSPQNEKLEYKRDYVKDNIKYNGIHSFPQPSRDKMQQRNSTNLSNENINLERKFREEVEKFLNDGSYKLFRSSTEGNFIVSLMNIQFTPKKELGRMIYSVSGTAYEVAECTISNLIKYNILSFGEFDPVLKNEIIHGQLAGIYTETDNLIKKIEDQLEKPDNIYEYQLNQIADISLIPYPKINMNNKILLTEAIKNAPEYVNKDGYYYYDGQIVKQNDNLYYCRGNAIRSLVGIIDTDYIKVSELADALKEYSYYTPIYLNINNKQIITLPDTPYVLEDQNFTLSDNIHIDKYGKGNNLFEDYYPPILFEYWGKVEVKEKFKNILKNSYKRKGINQLNGYFLSSDKNPYFGLEDSITKITTGLNNVNYYNSIDILKIIKDQIRLQVLNDESELIETIDWDKDNILYIKNKNLKIQLGEITNVVIQTQVERELGIVYKDPTIHYESKQIGPAGITIEKIKNNVKSIELLAENANVAMHKATVTYDFEVLFLEYEKLNNLEEGGTSDE